MPKTKKSKLPLFDIRINSQDQDVVLLKGSPLYASPALLSGTIALSVTEPLHVKKMRLKLYATMQMCWDEKYKNPKGQTIVRPYKTTKLVYCFDWDPINLERFLDIHNPIKAQFHRVPSSNSIENIKKGIGFTTGTLTRSNPSSSSNLKRLGSTTTLHSIGSSTSLAALSSLGEIHDSGNPNDFSQVNLAALASIATQHTSSEPVILQPGNYEFPFQCIIDGSIPESIVHLGSSSLVYRIQCVIERGRFSTPIITRKLIHIIRTLSPDNPELSETVAVDNVWPKKVDYTISVPTKAIAIGSSCHINISISPLSKGLKLGNIKVKLVEIASFSMTTGTHTDERTLTTKYVSSVTKNSKGIDIWSDEAEIDQDGVFYRSHNMVLSTDKWEVNTQFHLPASLELMTQDLDIASLCKVRHKLKFSVELINPDDHISELRATLPITLFISPFIPIKVKPIDAYDDTFQSGGYEDVSHHTPDENIIFQQTDLNATLLNNLHHSQNSYEFTDNVDGEIVVPQANINTQDLMAPPNYADRVYDKMFTPEDDVDFTTVTDVPPESLIHSTLTDHVPVTIPIPQENRQHSISSPTRPTPVIVLTQNMRNTHIDNDNAIVDEDDNGDSHNIKKIKSRGKATFHMGDEEEEDEEDIEDETTLKAVNSNLSGGAGTSNVIAGPAFNTGEHIPIVHTSNTSYLMTPGVLSPVQHLSRAASFVGEHPGMINCSTTILDDEVLKEMSNPPPYDVAVHSVATMKDLTPIYPNSESEIIGNLHLLDSRLHSLALQQEQEQQPIRPSMKGLHSKSTTALLKNSKSSHHIGFNPVHAHTLTSTSNGSRNEHLRSGKSHSTKTSPSISRNVSSTSLLSRTFKLFSHSHENELGFSHNGASVENLHKSPERGLHKGNQGDVLHLPLHNGKLTSPKSAHFAELNTHHNHT
ncbi:hypothetical protein CANINC_000972 [Pichia inconspicua]|uniref:Arrestin C-terminal-like domain-containing protein n=1 Tax=Pichia inconspicua TaxID=52247 RepID=A0A4T0X4T4_9ASCO|nr:hypothetical protein CANINC_000972 [[Candida] inconspicua]